MTRTTYEEIMIVAVFTAIAIFAVFCFLPEVKSAHDQADCVVKCVQECTDELP